MARILNYTDFLIEKWNQQHPDIILEGGAAGHMMHPFDDETLTFGEIKHIIDGALEGRLDFEAAPTEKTDGQNVFVTVKNGQAMFARNKGQMKQPLDLNGITQMFQDHPSDGVRDTFTFAAQDLASALQSLSTKDQQEFNDGTSFMNMELIYSGNSNVIAYGKDVIQFHGMVHTDGEGNQTGSDSKLAGKITNALKSVNSHVQKTFEIIPPQELQIGKSIDFEEKKTYFLNKVDVLQKRYGLQDTDPVSKYHSMWWKELIDKDFSNLDEIDKAGLVQRWAFDDKKTLNVRDLAK